MRPRLIFLCVLAVLLAAVWGVCRPGLTGGFLFDDYGSLPPLGATGPVDNMPALWRYVTSGTADPTGRPVTVASFLLDAHDWPASPAPFKRTNLLIHLLNTALLAALLLALGRRAGLADGHARRAALLGAALWGLHPLFISTTFYIVQREAMLAATWVLAGLLTWLAGRRRLLAGQPRSGLLLVAAGLGLGTLLATLSKANGALLSALALVVEYTVLRRHEAPPPPRVYRWTLWLLAGLPALAVLAYLLHTAAQLLGGPPPFGRPWTEGQRLLTEPRVLWDYLRLLWLPRPFTPGLFNDQIRASTGLLRPWTTLPALLGVLALVAAVPMLLLGLPRRRWRGAGLWAFAIAFYLVGQSIESTTIPLELYFEHRNYLPALPMFWPLAVWLTAAGGRWRLRAAAAAAVLLMLGVMTHARATLWGNLDQQALLWARLNPDSPRAQSYAAQIMTARGHPQWAVAHLRPLLRRDPGQIQIAFNLVGADCALGGAPPGDLTATRTAIAGTRVLGNLSFNWLRGAIDKAKAGSCPGLTLPVVRGFIDAAWNNPATRDAEGWQQDILDLRGHLALAEGRPLDAYHAFLAALAVKPEPAVALRLAATLGDAGHQHLALCELTQFSKEPQAPATGWSMARVHRWVLRRQHYWPHEIAHLRAALTHDLPADRRGAPCPPTTAP